MRIRQICLVARRLEPVVSDLCDVLDVEVAFRDEAVGAFGLCNAVMPVGDQFLEVVSPIREGTTAGRFLDRRGGDGGYMVLLQTADLAADRRRLETLGVRIVWEITLDDIATVHLHPRDVGGAILSLDEPHPPDAWRWGGPEWMQHVRTDRVAEIVGAEIQATDPRAMASHWAKILGLTEPTLDGGAQVLVLDGGAIRFVAAQDERGEGLGRVVFRAPGAEAALDRAAAKGLPVEGCSIEIGGTWLTLRDT